MFGSDWLANLFLSFFLFGMIFTVASVALGFAGSGHVGHGHAGDAGHAGGGHADAGGHSVHVGGHSVRIDLPGQHDIDIHIGGHHTELESGGHDGPGLLNTPTIMAFITWFGGIGYILRASMMFNGWVAGSLALISGAIGAAIMFTVLARVLWPMMTKPLDRADYSLPGTAARVVSGIRSGGVGEIVYSKGGTRVTAGARSLGTEPLPIGTEVVIISYERGLAYVKDVAAVLDGKE